MKRLAMTALLLASLGVGCMENQLLPAEKPPAPKTTPRPSPPPVTADQVTEANAHESLLRLENEIGDVPPRQGIQPPAVLLPDGTNKK